MRDQLFSHPGGIHEVELLYPLWDKRGKTRSKFPMQDRECCAIRLDALLSIRNYCRSDNLVPYL